MNKQENYIMIFIVIVIISIIGVIIYSSSTSSNNFKSKNVTSNINNKPNNTSEENNNEFQKEISTKITDNEKKETLKEEQIAFFSTIIYDKDEGRIFNLKKATEILNDTIVPKDSIFSFNETIGAMTEVNGFKKAKGFDSNGNIIDIFGGGMCQISSTLYNACLFAKMEIVERHKHSSRVYYVPIDKDATIYYGHKDFKFKNKYLEDVKIKSNTDGNTLNIYLYKLVKEQV